MLDIPLDEESFLASSAVRPSPRITRQSSITRCHGEGYAGYSPRFTDVMGRICKWLYAYSGLTLHHPCPP